MKVYNDKIIAEPGYILVTETEKSFTLPLNTECTERDVNFEVIKKHPDGSFDFDGINVTYDKDLMKRLITKIYTNNEQIAIILNKDDGTPAHLEQYEFIQEWRKWFHKLIKAIIEVRGFA